MRPSSISRQRFASRTSSIHARTAQDPTLGLRLSSARRFSIRAGNTCPITIIRLDSTRHVYERPEEVQTVLEFFRKFLEAYRPDVMLTYGGDPITLGMIAAGQPARDSGRVRPP